MLAYLKTGKPKSRKKLSKKAKILTLLSNGESVTWKTLRRRFDLQSPRAMVDQLREEGNMVYINQSKQGVSYRLGTPTKEIIAAGIRKVDGANEYAYSNQ
jgi:predicted HTH transcriptional regulator